MDTPDPVTRLNAALQGRYAIERELGEGGMATVYLADDLKHERKVALKLTSVFGDGMLYGSDTEALFAWGLAMTLTGALFCQIFAGPLARL